MTPVVSIVGKSNSGKTTLLEKLIPEITRRGYRVGTVKHDVHGFEMDREGKDSWRHRRAGSYSTIISSPAQLAVIRTMDHDAELYEIRDRFIRDVDIVLSEGYKKGSAPKIEIFRREEHREPLCVNDDSLVAMISNQHWDLGVPCLELHDISGLADIIEDKFLKVQSESSICLMVNGKHISLKPFIANLLERSIKGSISSLRDCENPQTIEITIG